MQGKFPDHCAISLDSEIHKSFLSHKTSGIFSLCIDSGEQKKTQYIIQSYYWPSIVQIVFPMYHLHYQSVIFYTIEVSL